MRIIHFENTDTTLVEFSDNTPVETHELNENIYLDLDSEGRIVSMTIEHAGQSADMREFLFQRIPAAASAAKVKIEIPVDGYDAEPWNGVTDYCHLRLQERKNVGSDIMFYSCVSIKEL